LSEVVETLDSQFEQFRISEALMTVYTTVRDDFSGWMLEIVKPAYQKPIDIKTYNEVVELFDQMLRLMHPFTPFITEEIWQLLTERKAGESIMICQLPKVEKYDTELLVAFENVKEAISGIRKIRTDKNIAQKETLNLKIQVGDKGFEAQFNSVVLKMGNLSSLEMVSEEINGAASFLVKSTNFFIPMEGFIDVEEELKKLEEELKYTQGFLNSVLKKLSNERFVAGAPEAVVALEKAKQADAQAKIKVLEERIGGLK
jgi:valyl-tRNA synthetase